MGHYRNIMEEIVLRNVDGVMKACDCCTCDMCKTDVITYALNRLPPKYASTLTGELLSQLDTYVPQSTTDIIFIIAEGAKLVKENSKHAKVT